MLKGHLLAKKATTENLKITKGKSSPIKANIQKKVENQPQTQLVQSLKDKSSKVVYIPNK